MLQKTADETFDRDAATAALLEVLRPDVRAVVREALVDEPATLDRTAARPVSPEMERLWLATTALYRDLVLQSEMSGNVLVRQEATRALIATAIAVFGFQGPGEWTASAPAAARRARSYIDEHLCEPITVHDVAAAARLSVRGVQYGFRKAYGMSPMAYLRAERLAAVRRDLLAADPVAGATVAGIARQWGFAHLGRFAGAYRDAYGESPSLTLGT
ncbi:helix-turn-helix transcriptional regulator [Microbacterium mangrovi]|uniref:helix-turn-helix transcriptional regulator n=1 Tax=Microbacterium mangrovi TaxID=1348253 RepID=UPI000691EF94|nr:helix-turn-helix transcriptional regulator [Microbacterium mangrovi]